MDIASSILPLKSACRSHPGYILLLSAILFATTPGEAAEGDPSIQLMVAATSGQIERVEKLLQEGVDVNGRNQAGRTPLIAAAAAGNSRIVRKLLAFGADVNAQDNQGITALIAASANGYRETTEALLLAGAKADAKDKNDMSALDRAKKSGNPALIDMISRFAPPAPEAPAQGAEATTAAAPGAAAPGATPAPAAGK